MSKFCITCWTFSVKFIKIVNKFLRKSLESSKRNFKIFCGNFDENVKISEEFLRKFYLNAVAWNLFYSIFFLICLLFDLFQYFFRIRKVTGPNWTSDILSKVWVFINSITGVKIITSSAIFQSMAPKKSKTTPKWNNLVLILAKQGMAWQHPAIFVFYSIRN